ncbi:MFS transporter [Williamsia sterculiae]|uniref:Drug resistance transporter, EmrB/QacA subfamily n=1 Tax=Williamsia sterculiae TaxID=1344003 RepID=A0A1N7FVZ7_9NOCA|nr:MFS transporter [Williamsia sterculiae]SIS04474.1 drug resistance transporter, EmrB/QacA subfamily [Williamsia sterculiae]
MSNSSVADRAVVTGRMPDLRRRLPRISGGALVLFAVLGCQLMVVVDATIVNVALPNIQRALDFSPTNLSWVLNAYTLTFGGLLLLGARLGDILGRRRTFMGGLALFVVASMIGGLATDSLMLLLARGLQGIGAAVAAPAALALLMTRFGEGAERTRALALFTAVSIGGFSLGLVLGGGLVQWLDWRWVFFVNAPIGLAVLIAGFVSLPAGVRHIGRFDLPGALTSTLGVGALVYGLVGAAEHGWTSASALTALVVGGALLAAFVMVERRAVQPITPLRLFASMPRSASFLGRLVVVAGFMSTMFFLTQYMQDVLHYGPLATGLAYLPMTAATFAGSQFTARWAMGRYSNRSLLVVAFAIAASGLFWLSSIGTGSSFIDMVGPLVLIGWGGGMSFLSLTTASLRGVHPDDAGAASGLVNAAQQLGGTIGLAVMVAVFGAAVPASQHGVQAFTTGVTTTFLVAAALITGGMVLMALTQGERETQGPVALIGDRS